jgi:hypothetical protein
MFWSKLYKLEEKVFILERKQKRYDILNNKVFLPLVDGLVSMTDDGEFIFDRNDVLNSRHYTPEGLDHLRKDIKDYDYKVNEIMLYMEHHKDDTELKKIILDKAYRLGKEIELNIIRLMETRDYNTVCNSCKKLDKL